MPSTSITLVGAPTIRGWGITFPIAKDRICRGVVSHYVPNKIGNSQSSYVIKRPGRALISTVSAGNKGTAVLYSQRNSAYIMAFGNAPSVVWHRTGSTNTNCGTLETGQIVRHITEFYFSSVTYWAFSCVAPATLGTTTGYYLASDAVAASTTFTGDRTAGSPVVPNVSSTAGLHIGQLISATGFAADTRILSIDSASQVTMTNNASSGAGTSTTFTREHIAKIIHASFPTSICGAFQELDGTPYIMDQSGVVWGTATPNTLDTWVGTNKFTCNTNTDKGVGLGKWGKFLLAFGQNSCEFLYNAGNQFGSPLKREKAIARGANIGPTGAGFNCKALIASAQDYVVWVGGGSRGCKVYAFDGELKDITDTAMGIILDDELGVPDFVGINRMMGRIYARLAFTQNSTYWNMLYPLDSPEGAVWTDENNPDVIITDEGLSSSAVGVNGVLTTGYLWDAPAGGVFQDNSANFDVVIQTEPLVLNQGKGFTIDHIDLIADTLASGTTTLKTSKDDYANFVNIGSFDMSTARKRVSTVGYYDTHVVLQLTYTGNTEWRAQVAIIHWTPATT